MLFVILIVIALVLAILSLLPDRLPVLPYLAAAVILICIALLLSGVNVHV